MKEGPIKILVAGLGGVGGYFGGLLAKKYANHKTIDIYFLARNKHLKVIKTKGLKVTSGEQEWVVHPTLASDNPADFGEIDIILLCTKSYDLPATLEQIKLCVFSETKFISFLNGVDHISKIKEIYPQNEVINGCAYIVSHIQEPGHIANVGKIQRLSFGKIHTAEFDLEEIIKAAEIDVICDENIESIIWEKFVFLSPVATITSYYQKTIGEILENENHSEELNALLGEVHALALKKGITLDKNCINKTLQNTPV